MAGGRGEGGGRGGGVVMVFGRCAYRFVTKVKVGVRSALTGFESIRF